MLEELLLSLRDDQRIMLIHLSGCDACQRRMRGLVQRSAAAGDRSCKVLSWPCDPYSEALDRSMPEVEAHQRVLARERAQAPALFVELSRHPMAQKDLILRNDPRYHNWGLF